MNFLFYIATAALITLTSCTNESPRAVSTADSLRVINESLGYRRLSEEYFQNHPSSPFKSDPPVQYEGLRWYPPDVGFYFTSKLHRLEHPETVIVFGTKGEPRKQLRYGYFTIGIEEQEHRLNVYKFTSEDIRLRPELARTLSVWFTDETTGAETYPVGRYLEIEPEVDDADHLYVVNLNNAHNPYCAYNPAFSCAIPTREDRLPVAIRAGEMNYHME